MPSVDVIVLSWNRRDVTRDFVESFLKHTRVPCRLIIIDQGSTDGSADYLRTLRGNGVCSLEIVLNTENKGFVGGMNQGLAMSEADYVCLANNDLLFTEGWLEEILAVFAKDKRIGLLNPNSNTLGLSPVPGRSMDDLARELRQNHPGGFYEAPFCSGFCMAVTREVIRRVGHLSTYLDFMFFEDTDYSMKAAEAGYLIGVAKASYVWHKEHASFKARDGKYEALMQKNQDLFSREWGRILSIGWVINREDDLLMALKAAVALARKGNSISLFTRFPVLPAEEIFRRHGMTEHRGVKIIHTASLPGLVWKSTIKKKKYHLVVNDHEGANRILRMAGMRTARAWDEELYRAMKYVQQQQ